MSELWLDAVLAGPVVGVQMSARPSSAIKVRGEVGAFLDTLVDETNNCKVSTSPAELSVDTDDGFTHKIALDPNGVHAIVQFSFAPIESRKPGSLPDYTFRNKPFSELTRIALQRTKGLLKSISSLGGISVRRLGLMTQMQLSEAQLPPGVVAFKNDLEERWRSDTTSPVKTNSTTLVRFKQAPTSDYYEQCHHALSYDMDQVPLEFSAMLDFQRVWPKSTPLNGGVNALDSFSAQALEYFQSFAFSGME